MKKSLLLLAAMGMGAIANAQTESAFMDPYTLLGEGAKDEAVSVPAGTELCASQSVTMRTAWDDTYKIVSMAGSSDAQQGLSIAGVYYDCTTGVQGQTNPKENSLDYGGQQSGAVFQFDVAQDGVLYVFGKLTYNKNYYVWEGDAANQAASPVAYTLTAFTVGEGAKVTYTLPGDELNYYVKGTGYDDETKYLNAAQCAEIYAGGSAEELTKWPSGNALGVIAFPVYAEAGTYFVNACGSKITCDGFVFIPGTDKIAEITNEGGAEPAAEAQAAWMDAEALLGEGAADEAVSVAAGTVLCETENVSMQAAWDDTYKIVGMYGDADAVKGLNICGTSYPAIKGIQGQTNPKENSLDFGGQQSGAVFKFEVNADGMLYVMAKLSYNKNYYVWEGDAANQAASPVAYTMIAYTAADATEVGYTLPGDEFGYYVKGTGFDDETKYLNAAQCTEIFNGGSAEELTKWTAGNALGVIAFPVYAEAGEYYVNACGSKVTCNGFVFVPGADKVGTVKAEAGETALNKVQTSEDAEQVINLFGQPAEKKGLVIVNGKKVLY